jgi:hypothetical protein
LESEVHEILVSSLDHIRTSGDTRPAVALLNAMPKGQRVQGMAQWLRHFSNGKVTLRQDANKVWVCALKERTDADFDMEGAEVTSYADLTQEATPKQMDIAAFVKSLERVSTNDATLKDGKPKVTADARALAARLVAFTRDLQSGRDVVAA